MKAKFLPFLLLAVFLQVSTFSFADEMISAREIRLKNKTKVQHRSIPVTPESFGIPETIPMNIIIELPLPNPFSVILSPIHINSILADTNVNITVIIKNAETDEVVYTSTDLNVDKVYIDLTGEEKGKYTLEIQLPKEAFTGDFELE